MSRIAERFKKPLHTIPEMATDLAIPGAKIGIEVEVENFNVTDGAKINALWTTKPDHSLRNNGMEFVTNGGLVGTQIEKAVTWLCDFAPKNKMSTGYPRAGIHIHMDVTDMNADDNLELARMMQTAMILEPAMFSFAGEHRRACGFCDAFQDSSADFQYISNVLFKWGEKNLKPSIEQMLGGDRGYISKYQAINLLPIATFGTVEFRQLPTTFEKRRIMDWINVILCLKRFSQEFRGDVIAMAKELGGQAFFSRVLGKWLPVLGPHYSERGFEEGLITAQLIKLKHTAKTFTPNVKPEEWPGKRSKILEAKIAKLGTPKKKPMTNDGVYWAIMADVSEHDTGRPQDEAIRRAAERRDAYRRAYEPQVREIALHATLAAHPDVCMA
jgi:hypothetical protein